MTWRYVAARESFPPGEDTGEYTWTVREYFGEFKDLGAVWSKHPEHPSGDDLEELVATLDMMKSDITDGTWFDVDTQTLHEGRDDAGS